MPVPLAKVAPSTLRKANGGLHSQEHFPVTSRLALEEKARMERPLLVGGIMRQSLEALEQVQVGMGRPVYTPT